MEEYEKLASEWIRRTIPGWRTVWRSNHARHAAEAGDFRDYRRIHNRPACRRSASWRSTSTPCRPS
ncbi:hypothetical protein INR49_025417 [Caranx melampygus]|nr:hypothetical protein INR49_025417 [Caranx melampygus]